MSSSYTNFSEFHVPCGLLQSAGNSDTFDRKAKPRPRLFVCVFCQNVLRDRLYRIKLISVSAGEILKQETHVVCMRSKFHVTNMADKTAQRRIDSFMNHLSYLGISKEFFHEASPSSPKSALTLSIANYSVLSTAQTYHSRSQLGSGTSCLTTDRKHSWRHSCFV